MLHFSALLFLFFSLQFHMFLIGCRLLSFAQIRTARSATKRKVDSFSAPYNCIQIIRVNTHAQTNMNVNFCFFPTGYCRQIESKYTFHLMFMDDGDENVESNMTLGKPFRMLWPSKNTQSNKLLSGSTHVRAVFISSVTICLRRNVERMR